ncbi:MAG: IS630 family transposase [Gammaproteobacteria bacterium]
MEKQDARTLSMQALADRRRRAVRLREKGVQVNDVAHACELSRGTVIAAHKAYRLGGWAGVALKPRGRPRGVGRRLSAEQESEVQKLICDKTPDQIKMPYALWSRRAVMELIGQRFKIKLPVRTVGLYLSRWGFTPQKPMKKAYEQRPADVKAWLANSYPAIAGRAQAEGAEIHWGDETGLRSDDVRGRSFAPKGKTPVVRVNSKRENVGLISTVTNQGKLRWMVLNGALDSDQLIAFLKRLVKDAKRKVFLILDNLRVHHAKLVKAWLAIHTDEIEVFYLPSYSPELNPDEMLNADLKQAVTTKAPARTKGQLLKATTRHMRKLQKSPERVKSYFEHAPVKYAA